MRVDVGRTIAKQRRCVVAMDGFYEWRPTGAPAQRQPYATRDRDGHPLGFVGVWSATTTADGEVVESVAVMTCPPQPPGRHDHDRMPLVIPRAAFARWLDPGGDATELLRPTGTTSNATPVWTW